MHITKELRGIQTPALLADLDVFDANATEMRLFAESYGIALRPHAKTVRSTRLLARIFHGRQKQLTVAKLEHAEVLSRESCRNIFIANMIVGEQNIERLLQLHRKGVTVITGVDSLEAVSAIGRAFHQVTERHSILVKVDTGLHRCGLAPDDVLPFVRQAKELPGIDFLGIYTHAGHAYKATAREIPLIGRQEGSTMVKVAGQLKKGFGCPVVSVGSTPTAKYAGKVNGVTEIRPGLYLFNDRVQVALGVCKPEKCALFVFATVISKPRPGQAFIDAGSQVFSPDRGPHGTSVVEGFGTIIGHPDISVSGLSEEHGWLSGPGVESLTIGKRLLVIPNHACSTVNLADTLYGIRNGRVEEEFPIDARGAVH